jgi:hypothetical protein
VKPREERLKAMVKARMRADGCWHDVCVLNLSSRGLGIQSADPPPRGTYVELFRGRYVVVARVIWTKGHRAGLRSQDPIFIQALLSYPAGSQPDAPPASARPIELGVGPRALQQRYDESRLAARIVEFAFTTIAAAGLGLVVFGCLEQALARPLSQLRTALGSD